MPGTYPGNSYPGTYPAAPVDTIRSARVLDFHRRTFTGRPTAGFGKELRSVEPSKSCFQ